MNNSGGGRPSFFKRKYLVDKKVQLFLTLVVLSAILIFIALVLYRLDLYKIWSMELIEMSCLPKDTVTHSMTESINNVKLYLVISAVILFIYIFSVSILITHRFAGPLFAMKKHMQAILEGDDFGKRPLTIRETDFAQDVIKGYNKLLEEKGLIDKQDK